VDVCILGALDKDFGPEYRIPGAVLLIVVLYWLGNRTTMRGVIRDPVE
jgi:hypothetical protein